MGSMASGMAASKKMCASISFNCLHNVASATCDVDRSVMTAARATTKMEADDNEAGVGRPGQASGLLAARNRAPYGMTL